MQTAGVHPRSDSMELAEAGPIGSVFVFNLPCGQPFPVPYTPYCPGGHSDDWFPALLDFVQKFN